MKEIIKGGKRKGSGRKPLPTDEKKAPVIVYVKRARIKEVGGIKKAKLICLTALE